MGRRPHVEAINETNASGPRDDHGGPRIQLSVTQARPEGRGRALKLPPPSLLHRNSTTSATGWYKISLTFSPTMPTSNDELCLKRQQQQPETQCFLKQNVFF